MSRYRRSRLSGGTWFFTVVTHNRRALFETPDNVQRLREAVRMVAASRPFVIDAMVVLPDHIHAIWTLPDGDSDFSTRWRLIKSRFRPVEETGKTPSVKRGRALWQRRFWEHRIRDYNDLRRHVDYIHYNPVRHGLVDNPAEWPYSSLHRAIRHGVCPETWGQSRMPEGIEMIDAE
ncbi:transposase [Methylonatrum kenyense]|uniref:REP-associated tyrosine transposase n=1 Tax=Methylonatrum kenyense TaxID=455253 RepID=UPI0020C05813|nr:transposase [Methylonatrum kenyense]MCK8516933.1 transposase [Methylonatrum kenyense]